MMEISRVGVRNREDVDNGVSQVLLDQAADRSYAASTPHRLFSCGDLRLIYGPSKELTEEYLTSSL